MKPSAGRASDPTGNIAVGHVAGDSLLAEVLSRIEDERERVLILAHVGLGISLTALERPFGMSRQDLSSRVDTIIATLRNDSELAVTLGEISRAGRSEQYQALAFRLGLEDWFCSYCGKFIVQRETGRRRKTCGDLCRGRLFRARGVGWKIQQQDHSAEGSGPGLNPAQPEPNAIARREKLLELIRANEDVGFSGRSQAIASRDRALLILGFTCHMPLSSSDLAVLDMRNVFRTPEGLEVLIHQRDSTEKQYVIIPADDNPELCPVRAISAWRRYLVGGGHSTGPLFIRMNSKGNVPREAVRLTSRAVVQIVSNTTGRSRRLTTFKDDHYTDLKVATSLRDYLNELSWY